jgi:hypothetical protein
VCAYLQCFLPELSWQLCRALFTNNPFSHKYAPYTLLLQNLVELNVSACRDLEDYGITCVVRGCPLLAKLNMAHSRYVPFVGVVRSVQCCVVLCAVMCVQLSGHGAGVVRCASAAMLRVADGGLQAFSCVCRAHVCSFLAA